VARREKTVAYLVGGPLRDVLLGRALTDIDIAVEGDAERFGRALSRELRGEFKSYAQFGTGTVKLKGTGDGGRGSGDRGQGRVDHIDIARTRAETYARSGALPLVRPAGIRADMSRRDFTINAMAWRLAPAQGSEGARERGSQGAGQAGIADCRLVDPYQGLEDLRRKVIRVLHEKSFEDDPTRIFRAARFAGRFGFRIEPRTRILTNRAIREGRLGLLSGKRVMTELALVMQESDPGRILRTLNRMGGFASLFGAKLGADCLRNISRIPGSDPEPVGPTTGRAGLRLLYLVSCLGTRGRGSVVRDWPLTREQKAALTGLRTYPRMRPRLVRAERPSQVYSALKNQARGALRIKAALEPKVIADRIAAFLDRYSLVKPVLTGQDFQRTGIRPGPIYAKLLDRLRAARLDGEVKTREDEERLVKTTISKRRMQSAK